MMTLATTDRRTRPLNPPEFPWTDEAPETKERQGEPCENTPNVTLEKKKEDPEFEKGFDGDLKNYSWCHLGLFKGTKDF